MKKPKNSIFLFCCIILAFNVSDGFRPIICKQVLSKHVSHLYAQKIIAPIFEDKCDQTGITLTRYMVETALANPHLRELESLMMAIQTACKTISSVVERASLTGSTGLEGGGGSVNVQGEEQKRLDVITNNIMKNALRFSGKVGVLASEEEDVPVNLEESLSKQANKYDKYRDEGLVTTQFRSDVVIEETGGKYVAVFDPLDGSSNVDAGIPTGTIFGIFEEDPNAVIILPNVYLSFFEVISPS